MIENRNPILIEGYSKAEILKIMSEETKELVFTKEPIVFEMGSAKILGKFSVEVNKLVIELAQIDGGGEGVLSTLSSIATQYSKVNGLVSIEWLVHATNCSNPNLKLRRILELRGFSIRDIPNVGQVYYFSQSL